MNRRAMLLSAGAALIAAGSGAAAWRSAVGSMAQYEAFAAGLRDRLTPDLEAVVRYATLAANSHNTQPWRFQLEQHAIEIRPDLQRRTRSSTLTIIISMSAWDAPRPILRSRRRRPAGPARVR